MERRAMHRIAKWRCDYYWDQQERFRNSGARFRERYRACGLLRSGASLARQRNRLTIGWSDRGARLRWPRGVWMIEIKCPRLTLAKPRAAQPHR
jgi:hypothetical protein